MFSVNICRSQCRDIISYGQLPYPLINSYGQAIYADASQRCELSIESSNSIADCQRSNLSEQGNFIGSQISCDNSLVNTQLGDDLNTTSNFSDQIGHFCNIALDDDGSYQNICYENNEHLYANPFDPDANNTFEVNVHKISEEIPAAILNHTQFNCINFNGTDYCDSLNIN